MTIIDRKVDAVYARIPKIDCKRLCQECCGPIDMSYSEAIRIKETAGDFARVNRGLTCSLLKGNECTVHAIRPAICRLWGVVEKMRCPHGCVPERWLTDQEAHGLLDLIESMNAIAEPPSL